MFSVLLLCEYSTLNGGEQSMLATLDRVRAGGVHVVAVCLSRGPLTGELAARGVEVLPLHSAGSEGAVLTQEQLRLRLREVILQQRPDVVHANSLSMSRLCGPVAAALQVPSIGHMRDIVRLSPQAIADVNRNTRLLAVSHAAREYHVTAGLDAAKTQVLYNGVDLDRFRPRTPQGYLHRELNLPADAQLIGSIGQIGMRKGLDVLFEAASMVARQHPRVHFLIVGQRHSRKEEARLYEADLQSRAASGVLAGRIHFLGWREDVDRLLPELTLLVHAAHQEPLGRVLLEAAAAGTPIVATDVGGTREIFPPNARAAKLVESKNPAALAAAISALLADSIERQRLATTARRRAQQAFDATTAGEALGIHYRQVAKGE